MKTFTTHGILRELGAGFFHRILEISPDLVVKVPLSNEITVDDLYKEYKITQELYHGGISVARPYGVYRIVVNPQQNITDPGIVMQRLYGLNVENLKGSMYNRATRLMNKEIRKCIRIGFKLEDYGDHNAIYSQEEDKTYLIDFQGWELFR